MRKMVSGLIGILIACGMVYTAVSAENPPPVPSATPAPAAAAPAAAPTAASATLSGKWLSNLVGEVPLEQTGNKIVGTYQYEEDDGVTQDGKIEGVVKDKMIQAKWWERPKVGKGEESRGELEWKITDDGKALMGWYREEGEKEKQDFNLTR